MNKFKSKKGFTLAELLIVVAIIAVLVAIAVPLFVGSLQKAQKARDDANIRAVRGAAAVYLLENSNGAVWFSDSSDDETPGTIAAAGWQVTATVTGTGDISDMTVKPVAAPADTEFKKDGTVTAAGSNFTVKLYLAPTEIGDIASSGLGG